MCVCVFAIVWAARRWRKLRRRGVAIAIGVVVGVSVFGGESVLLRKHLSLLRKLLFQRYKGEEQQ